MRKPSLLIIFLTVFIDLVGFGIVLPLLPRYSAQFGADGWQIGAIIGSFSVMQFLFAPGWGRLSDRIGRRPVLLIGNAGSAGSYALFALAAQFQGTTGLVILIASRIFAGICGATLSVASAYIADITPPETRSKSMGLIGMAFGLGFILGPALGAFSAHAFGLAGPGWVAAALCAFNFLLGSVILVESRQPSSSPATPRPRWTQFVHTLENPRVRFLALLFFLATFAFTCFESTLPLLLEQTLRYDERQIGYLFAFCGLVSATVQGGMIGRLIKYFGEERLIAGSLFVVAFSLALFPYVTSLGALLVALALFAAGSGINRAPTMGQISIATPADEQGATLGVVQSIGTMARIIGPIVATTLYAIRPAAAYLLVAALAAAAGVLAWTVLCRAPRPALGVEPQEAP